jgi:hypothetical protein
MSNAKGKLALMSMLSVLCAASGCRETSGPWPNNVSRSDLSYLRELQRETWDYIDYFIAPETGFPHDNNSRQGKTNTTNLGMYLASLCMAYKLGYVSHDHAVARITKILDSLDRCGHWNRLYNNWLDPSGNDTSAYAGGNNISDYNKLPASLLVVRQTFPEFSDRCSAFLDEIPWEKFYEPATGAMYYEFDVAEKTMSYPVYFFRGEDKILGHFLAIASGKVPADSWDKHDMSEEEKYGMKYYLHGWQGGGLFMQFICGLFVDDAGTKLGRSSANFAWAQMIHAMQLGAPVWGWSACVGPDEQYHGMGDMQDAIVTPHASALAISLFPRETIDNLKRLESYGLRRPCEVDGRERRFGFRDSVNWRTGDIADAYLVLDQAMLFLSLVNFCEDGLLWKTFRADPMVQRGVSTISDYAEADRHRAEQAAYIASLSYDEPGVFWIKPDDENGTLDRGAPFRREIWVRSLSTNDLAGYTQNWFVADGAGKTVAEGRFDVALPPRGLVKIGELDVPTDQALRGTSWKLVGRLKRGTYNLRSHSESVAFPSYYGLGGTWKLQAGDDAAWSAPGWDDSAWKDTLVPSRWEAKVLPDYDGEAWYRFSFTVPADLVADWKDKPLAIALGSIDDADETFLNGRRIGASGEFPPKAETAFNVPRLYSFDRAHLAERNVLAVRVSDWGGFGGIWRGPLAIGPADELRQALLDAP